MSDFGRSAASDPLTEPSTTGSQAAVCAAAKTKRSSGLLGLAADVRCESSSVTPARRAFLNRIKDRLRPVDGTDDASEGRRLTKEGISTAVVRVVGLATAIAIDIAIARLLSPDEAGIFFLLVSILSFCSVMSTI